MVGDGYLRKELEKNADNGIKFFGHVDDKKKIEFMKMAWIIAVPGIREGWGQVVTDANALGCPAIAYNIPGLRDSVKNGHNGLLIDANIGALAQAIIGLLTDDQRREDMIRNAMEWASRYSWDKSALEFERIVQETHNE
jgi:glycosyltransferase involved in cell wall biosynthesis